MARRSYRYRPDGQAAAASRRDHHGDRGYPVVDTPTAAGTCPGGTHHRCVAGYRRTGRPGWLADRLGGRGRVGMDRPRDPAERHQRRGCHREDTGHHPGPGSQLFRDAVGRLNRRAGQMARKGQRAWEPAPDEPALVIIVDEYAEMPEEAHDCADSIARRGRAVAVNLIAATQRPSQQAMGKGAVRSQMDIRICLRVRERREVDLILGQGSFNAGWHGHSLTQPGAFLISSPEHTVPERHRAYLLTDEQIARHAAQHAHGRPELSASGPDMPQTAPGSPQTAGYPPARGHYHDGPETALWVALAGAGPDGISVGELLAVTGMARPTLYRHLQAHVRAGRVVQVTRGYWRATGPGTPNRPGMPPRRDRRHPPGRDGQ